MTNAIPAEQSGAIKLKLAYPTVFPDFNAKNHLEPSHASVEISVQRMKHKHFRQMQAMSESKQIHYVMRELTGLSDRDLDELDAEDSAHLSEVIFDFMKHYAVLAKKMVNETQGER